MSNQKDRDFDASLGDQNTFQGQGTSNIEDRETRSLGDQVTFGSTAHEGEFEDNSIETVDLAARYDIQNTLGRGGMGEVLLAVDTRLNRKVAIKRILGDAARSKTAVNRFLTEAKSIAALNHPNVVQIYDYGRDADGPFLIMEYAAGGTLLDRCRNSALPIEYAVDIACQLCDGLGRAHDAGIIHRDIKPANILLTPDGIPKLTDFGLAKAESADTGMTMAGAVLGTLDFMPPEQRRDATLTDARSDLWSLAAMLYQMVTGKSPKVIKLNDIPKSLQEVLEKALEDRKADRYQSAEELKQALLKCLKTEAEETLELGACPHCGTKNDTNRKFCKKCGKCVEVPCMTCTTNISLWEEICGHCGAKQSELVEQRMRSIDVERKKAETSRSSFQYAKALDIARKVKSINDLRLSNHIAWTEDFLKSTQKEWEQRQQATQKQFEEAKNHREEFDYPAAIHAIESILEPLRTPEIKDFLQVTKSNFAESNRIFERITKSIQRRSTSALAPDLRRFERLRGITPELQSLLDQLRCPKCNRANEPGKAKCSGCDSKLSVPCMQCQKPMPAWDLLCEACGVSQAKLIEQENQALETQRKAAEQLLEQLDFDKATELAKELKRQTDPRLKSLQTWAEGFLKTAERSKVECMARITSLVGQAIVHEREFDYSSAIEKLKLVPTRFMGAHVVAHGLSPNQSLERNEQKLQECKRLQDIISSRLAAKQLNELLPEVESLLQLQPNRADTNQLKTQLIERDRSLRKARDDAFARAQIQMAKFNYANAVSELVSIDAAYVNQQILDLRQKAIAKRDRWKQLRETIASRVKAKDLHALLPHVLECLELQPNAEDLQKLRDQLTLRDQKNAEAISSIVDRARAARQQSQFDVASSYLQRIPQELVTQEISNLSKECLNLHSMRTDAIAALQNSMKSQKYARGVRKSKRYRAAIQKADLSDVAFHRVFDVCAQKAIESRRDLFANFKIGFAILMGITIVAGVIASVVYYQIKQG